MNAASKDQQGVSLNDRLYQGPTLLPDLTKVLLRFRTKPLAFATDISKMFLRVAMRKENQDYLRFLWRWGDASQKPTVLRMTTLPFGLKPSPFQAGYTVHETAKGEEKAFPEASTEISDAPDDTIVREPEPEIEIADDGPDDELEEAPPSGEAEVSESQPPAESLTRSEMMDETARLCKQLGWKNRQGSDFLQATYNKATRKDLTDAEMMDFLEQLRSLSTTEALPY